MNWRSLAGFLLLLVLAAATWWWLHDKPDTGPDSLTPKTEIPDYYFTDATITRLNIQGEASLKLHATDIKHYPQSEHLELETVRLQHTTDNGIRWQVTALSGQMPDTGKVITLRGKVHIERLSIEPKLSVDTSVLTLNTATDIAYSQAPIIVRQGASQITGTGLTLWLAESRLEMQNNVRGHYVQ